MNKIRATSGTRAEVIKMAPVIKKLKEQPDRVEVVVWATEQHREMLDRTWAFFGLGPDFDLGLMEEDQALASLTARALRKSTEVWEKDKYHAILLQGDTTAWTGGARCAKRMARHAKLKSRRVGAGLQGTSRDGSLGP